MRSVTDTTPVITGTGLVTALGGGVEECFAALLAGRSGIALVDDAAPETGCSLAGFVAAPYLRAEPPDDLRTQVKFLNGAGELAAQVSYEAHERSGWTVAPIDGEECGLWLAQLETGDWPCTFFRSAVMDATEELRKPMEAEPLNRASVRKTKPYFLLDSLKNNAFSFVSRWWDFRGANTAVSGFAGSTLGLLDLAARTVARGDQRRAMVVAAGRAANGVARADLRKHGLSRGAEQPAFRPLDENGTGCAPGEAAAALAVESLAAAKARGATAQGAILGYGAACGDPLRPDLPSPSADAFADASRRALEQAEVEPADLLGIVLPATGLPEADRVMLDAVASLPAAEGTPVVSWRGATGHCGPASELAEVVLAIESLRANSLPGTVGLVTPLTAGKHPLPVATTEGSGRTILVLSAGLQGEATAVVVASIA